MAVLDWEMATIGDPLADLGYLCMMWTERDDPELGMREHLGRVTRQEGFPTRAELIDPYEQRSGRSMSDIRWYTTLALWKIGRVHGGKLQARDRRAPPTTPTSSSSATACSSSPGGPRRWRMAAERRTEATMASRAS